MFVTHPRKIMVAMDGSDSSWNALKTAMTEFLGKTDQLILVSITNSNKTYLIEKYKPENLHLECKNYLISNVL